MDNEWVIIGTYDSGQRFVYEGKIYSDEQVASTLEYASRIAVALGYSNLTYEARRLADDN